MNVNISTRSALALLALAGLMVACDSTPIAPDKLYSVALSDFLASGGDNFGGLVPTQEQQATSNVVTMYDDVVLRDLMVEELQRYRGPLLSGNLQPARLQYPSPRPVRCPLTDKAPAPAPSTH